MRSRRGGREVVSFLPSDKKAGRYILILDDGRKATSYELNLEEASLFPLYQGKILSPDEEETLAKAFASSKAKSKALSLLKRRSYAKKELEERLLRDGKLKYPDVKEASRSLAEAGLLDDAAYAADKVDEAEYTLKGKRKVLHDLKEQLRHFHLKPVTVAAYDSPQSIGRYLFGGEPHSALVLCG